MLGDGFCGGECASFDGGDLFGVPLSSYVLYDDQQAHDGGAGFALGPTLWPTHGWAVLCLAHSSLAQPWLCVIAKGHQHLPMSIL